MPFFSFSDQDNVLNLGLASTELNLARALILLAIATAPAPSSRYQPGSSWTVVKYGTAIDPRWRNDSERRAAANPGIRDLDPHQKTILADDLGVALALACIDKYFGIVGLADCYGLWVHELLHLGTDGRHRRMPDFVILLDTPLNGSPIILLECKGSTRPRASEEQLRSACWQLNNVVRLQGLDSGAQTVPRVGIATTLHPGAPVSLVVSDPPELIEVSPELKRKLRANYVALELAAFGDLASGDEVRKAVELPTWANLRVPTTALQRPGDLVFNQAAFASLPRWKQLPAFEKETLAPDLAKRECVARVELTGSPSDPAKLARTDPLEAFNDEPSNPKGSEADQSEKVSDVGNRRRVDSDATTRLGVRAKLLVELW